MKLGYATPLDTLVTLPRSCEVAADAGFDFLEFPLAPLGLLEGGHQEAVSVLRSLPLPCLVAQSFLPRGLPLTGPDVDQARVRTYLSLAAALCHAVGARKAVFGAAWSRNVPDGWDRDRARDQLLQAFSWTAEAFEGSGCVVGIEPQNIKEANIVRTLSEAVGYAAEVNHDAIRVAVDSYHLVEERTPLTEIGAYRDWILHVQIADSGRQRPGAGSYDFAELAPGVGVHRLRRHPLGRGHASAQRRRDRRQRRFPPPGLALKTRSRSGSSLSL